MTSGASPQFGVAPLGPALLEDPVAFLSAEHTRQIALLGHLDRLARAPAARGARRMAEALLRWLTEELPIHIADEERSLYPRLAPHDAAGVVARLSAEHRRDATLAAEVVRGLRSLSAAGVVDPAFVGTTAAFTRLHREHLAFEEAAVTPLARQALTPESRATLAAEMAARRGLQDTGSCPTQP
ncbi:MAG: hemerythrin domain-containing protein [Acetobacteraceae bacterium]|nr:hemerythrin domain-containing protein [Acetobacteraceae bacterium]